MDQATAAPVLHRVTLVCEEDEWRGLVSDIREHASGDLASDIRKRVKGRFRYVELITRNVDVLSALVHERAPSATVRVAKAKSATLPAQRRAGTPSHRKARELHPD